MPIYEYECSRCHHRFELRQGFDAEPCNSCPQCQSIARRVLQPVGIVFRGSGFYVTDNRKDGGGQAEEKRSEPEAKKEPDESKTEKSTSKEASASSKETSK